jgi:hypothetical protein
MRDPHSRTAGGGRYATLFVSVCSTVFTVMLSSCSADLPVQHESQQADGNVSTTRYSIVCVIHGDGDYLYHDTDGIAYTADEEALVAAQRVAQQNPGAEVFIFHQRPRSHVLFLFPLRDGDFYYYRGGRLVTNLSYWRDQEQSRFDPEVELYRRFREENLNETVNVFLYLGHEIPESGGAGYDASYPDRPFTVHGLADGLRRFTRDSVRCDLVVLSACFGGTPYTIGTLGPFARYIIASPDNLHLSYFDLHSLERLDLSVRNGDVHALARQFAQHAYDRLTENVQTAVSVVVYDVDRTQEFLRSVRRVYDQTLTTVNGGAQASIVTREHCDCADLPVYVLPTMNDGVDVLYRPARFGRQQHKQQHSGWECWRERAPQAAAVQNTEPALK